MLITVWKKFLLQNKTHILLSCLAIVVFGSGDLSSSACLNQTGETQTFIKYERAADALTFIHRNL